jgi:hypothetical protein
MLINRPRVCMCVCVLIYFEIGNDCLLGYNAVYSS